ncbi:tRNA pseudouridine synthase B [Chondromyces apiculatus]|uniref:tRNA pseudouridine synthase B n=1 Tax=Chondromyces apiculatus DSM 436 TaxID=1192034 RepID=A0A017T375_9BACT|nr:tRNA pseudouridine(55) synthase TruB [Chondromyces apiculatus]EYF03678.1 tRNA pseudouridine synthase B [Chondromyces apiculatus DSM 436]
MKGEERAPLDGVLVVDKPRGPTSHDVVWRLRKALRTKRIGHAGTLDPMASGVLVILVGEGTKLGPYLTAQDKHYVTEVALGVGTNTLDAEGEVTETRALPGWLEEELAQLAQLSQLPKLTSEESALAAHEVAARAPRIAAALAAETARRAQVPPAHSAIKVDGQRSYALARAGKEVELAARDVEVRALGCTAVSTSPPALTLTLSVQKGYYVRSLARDLGEHLGVPAHLTALRRTASGRFTLDRALPPDAGADALRRALVPLVEAASLGLWIEQLTADGARRARLGQRLRPDDFTSPPRVDEGTDEPRAAAWIAPDGQLVAIGCARLDAEGALRISVLRGFSALSTDAAGAAPSAPFSALSGTSEAVSTETCAREEDTPTARAADEPDDEEG